MTSTWKKTSGVGWARWTKKGHADVMIMKGAKTKWLLLVGKLRKQKIVSRHRTKAMAMKMALKLVRKM